MERAKRVSAMQIRILYEVFDMKKVALMAFVLLALAGCKDRVIWDDKGKVEAKTQDREVWDSNGKMKNGEREVWVNKDGEEVVK